MESVLTRMLLGVALIALPLSYLAFCVWMAIHRASKLCYPAYFVLFGTFGGWCLAVAMSPSGLAATCMIFLTTLAPVSCLASSLILQFAGGRTRLERIAMVGGYCYPALLLGFILAVQLYYGFVSPKT